MFCPANRIRLIIVVWLLACTSVVQAKTITVMQDGSGGFELIQPALDAAASGDTILIGPGEYLDSQSMELQGYPGPAEVFAFIPVSDLTIIGAGKLETFIGPITYEGSGLTYSPIGIRWIDGATLKVCGITIRNCFDGLQAGGGVIFIDDCNILDNSYGIYWSTEGSGGWITNCNVSSSVPGGPTGLYLVGSGSDVVVEECLFDGAMISVKNLENISIIGCEIRNMVVGLQVDNGTHCYVEDCRINNCVNVGISLAPPASTCEIIESEVSSEGVAVKVHSYGELVATNSIFNGGGWAVFEFNSANEAQVSNCQLFPGDGPAIRSYRHPSYGEVVHDLRNNFWGTIDGDEIRSLILDGIEDPDNTSTVLFEPFVSGLSSTDIPQPMGNLSIHPNPFNPRTTISFSIDHPQNVELCIFDMTGKRIAILADRSFQAGDHSIDWQGIDLHGRAVASGSYLLRMITDDGVKPEKMMLVR